MDFEPCGECKDMISALTTPELVFGDDQARAIESAKFLRHLTYNHPEVVQAVMGELPRHKERKEFDFFK